MSGENIPEIAKVRHYKELLVWQRSMLPPHGGLHTHKHCEGAGAIRNA